MNLIEQLGGYENVSKHFNRVEYHAETKIFIGEWFGFYSMRDLKDALLEYRRQHNIYEPGDRFLIDGFFGVFYATDGNIPYLDYNMIRHATDAEIAAGRRL